ncbi:MAG TPA: hypothetical protein VHB99_09550 [Pirellulales bacterium]|nr:hypothetical protein [Pirellulales bacterium]
MPARNRGNSRQVIVAAAFSLPMAAALLGWTAAQAELPFEQEPINYLKAPVHDPVAKLQERLDRGEAKLAYDDERGYLPAVLEQLAIAKSSQTLVFSKTSFQRQKISPRKPRAVYFNDDTYIGYVQRGEVLEVSTVDPDQGAVFYTLSQTPSDKPVFQRQTHDCLQCHSSSKTQDVPGHLVRSVYPDASGMPVFSAGTFTTTHESPLRDRWGGWYVSGQHGTQTHMGNVVVTNRQEPERLDRAAGANRTSLDELVDTTPYLASTSDIVALMVLEHQTKMHNLITAANYHARLALHYEAGLNKALNRPAGEISPSTARRYEGPAEKLIKYMLFCEEAPLAEPVAGSSDYAREFAARGPRDSRGRSLRDFDLSRRLFKYPCSYEIYSDAFESLPPVVKQYVYRRLKEILTGADPSSDFAHLSADDRRAIFEILLATKQDLPADWCQP